MQIRSGESESPERRLYRTLLATRTQSVWRAIFLTQRQTALFVRFDAYCHAHICIVEELLVLMMHFEAILNKYSFGSAGEVAVIAS